jgi:cyclopropane-fatty-acyl-phospholipid synthase
MKLSIGPQIYPLREKKHFSFTNEIAREALFSLLKEIKRGKIILIEDNNRFTFGQATEDVPFTASITVHNSSFYRALILGSDIGAAEAFMDGFWSTDDLTTVIYILLFNYGLVNKIVIP